MPPFDGAAVMRIYISSKRFSRKSSLTVALRAIAGRGVRESYGWQGIDALCSGAVWGDGLFSEAGQ